MLRLDGATRQCPTRELGTTSSDGNARSSEIAGTGLGLSIVKRLVTSFRGIVTARSELGQGTTFTVALPLAGAPAADIGRGTGG